MGQWIQMGCSRAFATLCLLLAATTAAAAPRKVNVIHVRAANWTSDDLLVSGLAANTTVTATNCGAGNTSTNLSLGAGDSARVAQFERNLCSTDQVGVVQLTIDGDAQLTSEATYEDAAGNKSLVSLPAFTDDDYLPGNLPPGAGARYVFNQVENSGGTATFLALFAKGRTWLDVAVYGKSGSAPIRIEHVELTPPFVWYQLETPIEIGHLEVRQGSSGQTIGCGTCDQHSDAYAVAFVGSPAGGTARRELPAIARSLAVP